jgi:peptidoglycan/xylan/chitin deacetylase (PgdA/CDA1 family)
MKTSGILSPKWPVRALAHMPLRFALCKLLGRRYSLRSVLFHHIADEPSPFTEGLGVTTTKKDFERTIVFLTKHYTPVTLEEALDFARGAKAPRRPVLVTFDDAYASIANEAVPICQKYRVPAIFFVNARFVGNCELALDNLVCYVANIRGFSLINATAKTISPAAPNLVSLAQVLCDFLPRLSIPDRERFGHELAKRTEIDTGKLAQESRLYVTADQLRSLPRDLFDIGNHTYSHVSCRALTGRGYDQEINQNKAVLESMVGRKVLAFSVPYGSTLDLTDELIQHLRSSNHRASFLVESVTNVSNTDLYHLSRVSVSSRSDIDLFSELELLPRIRAIRNRTFRRSRPFQQDAGMRPPDADEGLLGPAPPEPQCTTQE